ncbi:30S ribosomal protein S2 [Candidatus Parcubacteria bacterium]|nr:30S ribosomal protein S2 [Patescibacteria group bacterium]MBU4482319.1 30S ribosomal protein S2 [Patescibacteria group bacterium]MCG2686789.1 30S ribosomal protein S2 [Candidatus Parcubacteria bacterium]
MKITEKDLLNAGVHFGHKPSSWHPRMSDFIFGQKNNVHIIDLTKTKQKLEQALEFIKQTITDDKQLLFVGTKIQAKDIIKKYAQECKMPYVEQKWLGGTLTNFKVINGLVKKLEKFEAQAAKDDYEQKYTKKERHTFNVEMERLTKMIEGIRPMKQTPVAIFAASAREEKTAISEANKKGIPIIAICDTNTNPTKVTYPIPANDDATKSIELITKLICETVMENKK